MPALAANQVTLAEVLEVKGKPLSEEEIWAVLCQASKELEVLLAKGKGKYHGQPALFISPETLILSHSGRVKFSASSGREKYKNPKYRAPELSSKTVAPSDGAVEKMYVYSLGMTVYFAAEYELGKSKLAHLGVSLGNLLVSMCEELARVRYSLRQVLQACGSKYDGRSSYGEIIKSLVVMVLGNNIPEMTADDDIPQSNPLQRSYSSEYQHPSRGIRSRYRSSLELPSPPLVQRVTHGQATTAELVGSNERILSSPEGQHMHHSQNKFMTKIPHTLDKYRKYLEKARNKKSESITSPVVADRSIDLNSRYGSLPSMNGQHSFGSEFPSWTRYRRAQSYHEEDKGYEEGPFDGILSRSRSEKLPSAGLRSLGNYHAPSSDASSETSSLSDHRKSTLSSGQSSSLVSLLEGSYVPESSLMDHRSDYWGSTGSLRTSSGLGHPGEWHRSSVSDLRSVSQLSNIDQEMKQLNGLDHIKKWPSGDGQRKYHSEQNLVSPDSSEGGKKQKKVPKVKLRKFFGPEFVQVTEDPDKSLVNITPKKNEKPVSGRRLVTVVMLNKQRLEVAVESSSKVQDLFTQITKYIGITEKIYFGLARLEDDEHFFLDFDSKLSKHAPPGWKEQSKKSSSAYTLYFRVKFYVENLSLHRHQETTHQFYLQLRNDIIDNQLYCDEDQVLNLASLALQAEYGDYSRKRFGENYFKPRHYIPNRILVETEDYLSQKLRGLHKIRCGLSQEEAELKFIKEAKKLPEYGMHFYKTQWNKEKSQVVYLGVCVRGVTIYEPCGDNKSVVEKYSWQMIKKLAFKKKKFCIEPRADGNVVKQNKKTFYSSSYKRSKYLLYLCTSFHRFQMRMKVRLLSMDEPAKGSDHLGGEHGDGGQPLNGTLQHGRPDSNYERGDADSRRSSFVSHEELNGSIGGSNALSYISAKKPTRTSPYILESSPTSPTAYSERGTSPLQANTKTTADIILSPDRQVRSIKLRKDAQSAIGLTVVGGEDTNRLHFGIFIKKITPRSVADKDGRLQVGDRILAVNGKSLEYVNHDEAVQTLKNTRADVELLVSQSTRTDSGVDLSALSSPAVKKHYTPREDRASPYLAEDERTPVGNHSNHDVIQDPELPKPPAYRGAHKPRSTSVSSSDIPVSKSSSPEPGSRGEHYGGVKLPGMEDERMLQDVKLSKHRASLSSHTSRVSEESPGSIASFGEKVHRQNSLPQSDTAQELDHEHRKASFGSVPDDGRLGHSGSNSGIWQDKEEKRTGDNLESRNGSWVRSGSGRRTRTPSVKEVQLEQRNSDGGSGQLPVGVVWENEGRRSEDNVLQPNQFTVELNKESGSLGLNVTGGTNTSVKNGAIYVKSLYPNGPADLDGRIQVGHKIVSVNGISLQGVTHKQAVETIKRAPAQTVMVIEGPPLEEDPTSRQRADGFLQHQQEPKERVFEVVLMKGIGGLGMSLVGGIDYSEEYGDDLRIKAMFPGQPAENSDQLRIGDIILAANGVSLQGKTNRDAINVLRDQPTRVVLLVKRDPSSIPPGLLRRGSFSQNIDPNEVLSVIHSKIHKEDSRNSQLTYSDSRKEHSHGDSILDNGVVDEGSLQDDVITDKNERYVPSMDERHHRQSTSSVASLANSSGLPLPPVESGYLPNDNDNQEPAGQEERRSSAHTLVGVNGEHQQERSGSSDLGNQNLMLASNGDKKERLAPDEEVIDLVLYKGSSGLGFTLAGGADTVGGCFVREIIGDPARSDGRLRAKDQIVMVNGQDTTNKTHMEAVNVLRSTRNEVHLVIRRRPDKVKSQTKDGLSIKTVSVIRTTRGRVGLTLGEDKEGQIYVEDVVSDEPAAKDGGLKRGDIILEINGDRIDGTGLLFAQQCLDNARPVVTLVLKQFRTENESKYMLSSPTESEQSMSDGSVPNHHVPQQILKPQDLNSRGYVMQEPQPREYFQKQRTPKEYAQDKHALENQTPEELTQEKRTRVQAPDESQPSQPEVSRYEQHSSEQLPTVLQPLLARSAMGTDQGRRSINEKYSRHKQSGDMDSSEPIQYTSGWHGGSESDNDRRDEHFSGVEENDELRDKQEGLEQEHGNEAYQYDDDDDDVVLKEEVFVTILEKGPRGLGFSLFSGRTINDTPGLFIRSIQPNSVVAEDGKIKVGDQLLKVNDEDVETLNHSQVITMLRRLSGMVKLEMLRIQDGDEEEDEPFSLPPGQPGTVIQSSELPSTEKEINQEGTKEAEGAASTVTTPDFTEDLNIVLNALNKTKDDDSLSNVKNTDSVDNQSENVLDERINAQSSELNSTAQLHDTQAMEEDENMLQNWPEPPTSLQLETNRSGGTPVVSDGENLDYNDNPMITTSEDDTTSVTFSEDGFLEELEDSVYTPSPDSEAKRPGIGLGGPAYQAMLGVRRSAGTDLESSQDLGISGGRRSSGVSRIPIKEGSPISKGQRTSLNNVGRNKDDIRRSSISGDESIEMNVLRKDNSKSTGYLSTSRESTPRTKNGKVNFGTLDGNASGESRASPLIPESFLNASQAVSPSRTISPDVPPPLPTTPIPSDDDLGDSLGSKGSSKVQGLQGMAMRERLEKVANEANVPKGRFDFSLRPRSPLILRRPTTTKHTGPLLDISERSVRYSGECLKHVVRKLEDAISSGQAADEYQALREMKPMDNCPSGKRALNKEKNRYRNVLPYEKTRVVLSGDEQTDYINANHINITVGSDTYHYIATQGPLPGTTSDFWKMVWEQKSQVIAMLTLDMESGKVKCHRYWPESPELPVKVNDSLEVHLESVKNYTNFVRRLVKIKNIKNNECLKVVHLNFVAWPDHGVPKSAYELVDFIKNVGAHSSLGPCVIHCSAGIGRTGTMLTVNTCTKHIEKGLEFDMYSIVRHLREQRPGMIQTKDQYVFCYQSCVEVLKSLEQ